ncbi:CRISPR-associated endonuclease/helicase Cas3 [Hymenobacter luteus]|uniref:CRISPR-associated endonuclease/helicase Cas3 n=2 Tax=Hymenobacter TaxID=89966 RepID=A0A7W9T366_9BACT|nr:MULTISPECIES: CRISPR-associated helicase Cas3' [Hymenobacter]MBB4601942.1 CRISPR-associated endonuclease/helicase Cas3 [Hymenobacter latericoloratus]MBB6059629.1 CRISPR-associated endonuclease/helicase Cas3 [Hymenobacter luteus]
MLTHLIAKTTPRQSLQEHCDRVLEAWAALRASYDGVLPVPADFWQHSFLSVLLHDFGKISPNFENKLREALGEPVEDATLEHLRHEFLSAIFWLYLNAHHHKQLLPTALRGPVLAVMTHHKSFSADLFLRDEGVEKWQIRQADFMVFLAYARHRLNDYGFATVLPLFAGAEALHKPMTRNTLARHRTLLWQAGGGTAGQVEVALREASPERREEYIKYKALLYAADWTASGNRALELPLRYTAADLRSWLAARAASRGIRFAGFRVFQEQAGNAQGNVVAIAPTGSGKTEAALLWAANRPQAWARIVYLLPTRVTSNALYERLNAYFGKDAADEQYTAVVHSSAKLYRQDIAEQNGRTYQDFDYLRESSFFKPVTVATVDQVLTSGFNLGWWELKTLHLFRASVVLDEVHAYEPYTLGLLVSTIRYLRQRWQTRFLVMTATLPSQLRHLLTEALGGTDTVELLQDRELLAACRNRFRVVADGVDALLPEIRDQVQAGRKVLLVVNTVNEAIRLQQVLADLAPMCYHSRFIVADRQKKERELEQRETDPTLQGAGFLLIATQVAEVSLDIDYDRLYTENAPIDALIQRAGRVNRRRSKLTAAGQPATEVVVFQHTEAAEKVYDLLTDQQESILQRTLTLLAQHTGQQPYLTEQDLLDLVDEVYSGWQLATHPSYLKGKGQHQAVQDRCGYLQDYALADSEEGEEAVTREGMDAVTIIPMQFRDGLRQIRDKKKRAVALAQHEVSIRRSLYLTAKRLANAKREEFSLKEGWHEFVHIPYSHDIGVYISPEQYAEMKNSLKDPDVVVRCL